MLDETEISRRSFRYLDFIIQDDGELIEDVTNKIKAGWIKWR